MAKQLLRFSNIAGIEIQGGYLAEEQAGGGLPGIAGIIFDTAQFRPANLIKLGK